MSKKSQKEKDTLLSDILTNIQLQLTLLHDQQTEMTNQLPASKRTQINALQRRIIEAQLEIREFIVRFNKEYVNAPDELVIPITYSSSNPPPSSLRNSLRVVKDNKRMTAAIGTIVLGLITLALRSLGVLQ